MKNFNINIIQRISEYGSPEADEFCSGGDEHPTSANISIRKNHELVELTHIIDWPEFIELAMDIRAAKVKSNAGKEPHYRELLGAIALISIRSITFRQAEDFNRPLCSSEIPLQLDGFNLESRSYYNFRFYSENGSRWNGASQLKVSGEGSRLRTLGPQKINERHDSSGGNDPLSERSGLNESILSTCLKGVKEICGEVFRDQRQSKRSCKESKKFSQKLSSFCKNERGEKKSRKKTLSHIFGDSGTTQEMFIKRRRGQVQASQGIGPTVLGNGNTIPSNSLFSRDRLCCFEKNYTFANDQTLFNCSRQGWEVRRIWIEMGDQWTTQENELIFKLDLRTDSKYRTANRPGLICIFRTKIPFEAYQFNKNKFKKIPIESF